MLKPYAIAVLFAAVLLLSALGLSRCSNNPHRAGEAAGKTLFTVYSTPPAKLDPAESYYIYEADIIDNIVEPPLDYHFLKRPYEIVPLTAESMPRPEFFDRAGARLDGDPPADQIARVEYTVHIRRGLLYRDHPCFATNSAGQPLYRNLTDADVRDIRTPYDFPVLATREATAEDFATGIRRLADPRLSCPILSTMNRNIAGMEALGKSYAAMLEAERARRKGAAPGSDARNEDRHPIVLDYMEPPFEGVQVLGRYTFKVVLNRKYPQILYWMAMHFFAPIPREAIEFHAQAPLIDKQIVLNRWPMGTGPFYLQSNDPGRKIVLQRNLRFRAAAYPAEGEPSDRANGFLDDAGRPLPLLDRVVFALEKEAIPLWNKFLQGYYDVSGITAEAFERTITLSSRGDPSLSDDMRAQGITMQTDVGASLYWFGFNMLDDVVGGYTPERRKLRQAVSIALDYNEFLDIFLNGRGLAAQGLIPPGLFGHTPGAAGINPYVDQWDPVRNKTVRRPIEDARRLLAEAGYPQGRSPDGRPLVLSLDHSGGGDPAFMTQMEWTRKRLKLIGVDLQERGTELKRFREKMDAGNFQLCRLGWMADYPDAENFMFLLYGPNAKYKTGGENKTNYENPEYDGLFEKMESMENGPERQAVIDPMMDIARRDAPMCWGYHPVLYGLSHAWHHNGKPHQMTRNTLKYIRVDPALRVAKQRQWNRPRVLPILLAEAALMLLALPAIYRRRRAEREGGAC